MLISAVLCHFFLFHVFMNNYSFEYLPQIDQQPFDNFSMYLIITKTIAGDSERQLIMLQQKRRNVMIFFFLVYFGYNSLIFEAYGINCFCKFLYIFTIFSILSIQIHFDKFKSYTNK